ncbi:MAG: YggT family protein [Anaerolineaceae bacterium]
MQIVLAIINAASQLLSLLVVLYSILSFFLPPYHAIRVALAKVIEPLLRPIQKVVSPMGGLDFSPMILLILVYVVEWLLTRLLVLFI